MMSLRGCQPEMSPSESSAAAADKGGHRFLARILRFKWPAFSAAVMFLAVYWIDLWFAHHGLRLEATLLDNFLISALVFGLGVASQLEQERKLEHHQQLAATIAEMNHHTRNALQVIVNRSSQSIADSNAVEDIRQAVKRIDWCLREILPTAEESVTRKQPRPQAWRSKANAGSQGQRG